MIDSRATGLDGFRDMRLLGASERAEVYAAVEIATGRHVTLKLLASAGVSPAARETFDREAAILGRLSSHPNIVTLYDTFTLEDGRPVLVMELCTESVAARIASGHVMSVAEVVALGIKIAGALETAHSAGVLHLNVRPENILITEFGEPALADFAVARLQGVNPGPAVDVGEFLGMHIAPELVLGEEATPAADVYGLAATLYILLTGHAPIPVFAGESPAASILRVIRDEPRPIVNDTIPLDLSDLLLWALAKDPSARPPSLAWLAEELSRIEQHQGWPRTRPYVRESHSQVSTRTPSGLRERWRLTRGRRRPQRT
jgi:serine/threonine protein kinase